jgi:hypothetical protein
MNIKRLAFWSALFCSLLLYILLLEPQEEKKSLTAKPEVSHIFPDAHNRAEQIEIICGSKNIQLVKNNGVWETVSPGDFKIRREITASLVEAVLDAAVIDIVDESPENMDQYGLLKPAMKVRVFNDKKTEPLVLSIGRKTPVGISVYARLNTSRNVFLTGTYLIFSVNTFIENLHPLKNG